MLMVRLLVLNRLHPNISMHILHTVLYTFTLYFTFSVYAVLYVAPIRLFRVCISHQSRCSNFSELTRDSERAVRKMKSFKLRNVGFSVFLTCMLPRVCYWTHERHQITYSKRVTRDGKMVDSCSRARSWLLFLHRLSGKYLNQIVLEELRNCTLYFDLSSSLTASCFARFMIC